MSQNDQNNGFFDKVSSFLGGSSKVATPTGQTNAENTQHAFSDDVIGLGTLLSKSGLSQTLAGKLQDIKSFDPSQMQAVLSALGQSSDPQVQSAKEDLAASQHDGETFVQKLKGYITSLSQFVPAVLPALQKLLGGNK